ncbi:MAG: hypothetical protein R3C01_04870 [Planctomycetaceae bacterium]
MKLARHLRIHQLAVLLLWGLALSMLAGNEVSAQPRRPNANDGPNVTELESKAKAAFNDYLTNLADLAKGYEDKGDFASAKDTLKTMLKLSPDSDSVKRRIKELEERVFTDNQQEFELDTSKGWISSGLMVKKGEPVRLIAEGSLKLTLSATVDADGFATADVMQDMAPGVACAALTGIIVPLPTPGARERPKPGKPFHIGKKTEFQPDVDGMLFVKVNAPPGSKCVGKYRIQFAGNIERPSR